MQCSRTLASIDLYNSHKWQLEYHATHFNHVTDTTQIKLLQKIQPQNKVHMVKT